MEDYFNIKVVQDAFLKAIVEEDDVNLKEYLDAFEELNKFCNLMGVIFTFVSQDLRLKMDVLLEFLANSDVCDNFCTVKKMIIYEKEGQLLNKKNYVSGSRTLLRLHRGLDFIRTFLKSIEYLKDTDNTSVVCREAYDKTLSHHHTFMIRGVAKLAIYTMPNRRELLIKMCGPIEEEIQKALEDLPEMLKITTKIFERIDSLYTLHGLHNLP